MMDTNPVSDLAVSASVADSVPAPGNPAETAHGDLTVTVAGSDLDVSNVVQESVVLESGEGSDGDGSGTPEPSGTSTNSDETTTTTSSEESLLDKDEQE